MGNAVDSGEVLNFAQLSELRGKTEAVARVLKGQLQAHLETLRPLFVPTRLLGHYANISSKESVYGADKALAQLREQYATVCAPFGLLREIEDGRIGSIDHRLELYPWEYVHQATGGGESKTVSITSPVRWVLTYTSGYSLSELRQALAGRGELRPGDVSMFVISALIIGLLIAKFPGLVRLFEDLRYTVETQTSPGVGELPFVTVSSILPSVRPSDDLILAATRFSGVPSFIELIDVGAVQGIQDPLKERIEEILR